MRLLHKFGANRNVNYKGRAAHIGGFQRQTNDAMIWPKVKSAAERFHLEIEEDQRAHLGIFYRSDHFSFAR